MHLIKDDPVRPHIGADWRVRSGKEVYVLEDLSTGNIDAVVCVIFMDEIPKRESDMAWTGTEYAVFYTVWSYKKGAGRDIIFQAQKHIKRNYSYIRKFVTLSPLTEMAERFHTRNGAKLVAKNNECQNFLYPS